MLPLEQIIAAHGKVKSGADFPAYIQEIKSLGVVRYETFVSDGQIDFYGADGNKAMVPAKYTKVRVSENLDFQEFQKELSAHQQGKTDYPTFIQMCADTGIEKWEIHMQKMTCTYFDSNGKEIHIEKIPD